MPSGRPRDVVVLGSGLAAPAAMDFAQKLRECGFAPARQTDPRDFAHGDFMAFDAAQTWMVAFGHGAQLAYLGRYLDPLPAELSVARVFDPDPGAAGAIGLFARARASFAALVEAHALHPGPADVPRWAGRLYQLPLDG
ncbi:MAG: hypothetical protein KC620_05425 [Myxococcales bacterium]|nr:hypothetical protein [Myxococcales bacterium]